MPVIDDIGEHQHMQAVNTGIYQTKKKKKNLCDDQYLYIHIYIFIYLFVDWCADNWRVLVKNIMHLSFSSNFSLDTGLINFNLLAMPLSN